MRWLSGDVVGAEQRRASPLDWFVRRRMFRRLGGAAPYESGTTGAGRDRSLDTEFGGTDSSQVPL